MFNHSFRTFKINWKTALLSSEFKYEISLSKPSLKGTFFVPSCLRGES